MQTSYITYTFLVIVMVLQGVFNLYFNRTFDENTARTSLVYAVNSASDVSTEYLLEESQETSYGNVYIDPETVWYVYKYTLLESIGLNSRNNIKAVDYFFPTVLISVNDGYFTRLITQENVNHTFQGAVDPEATKEWVYKFSQKIPYARRPTVATRTSGEVAEIDNLASGHLLQVTMAGESYKEYPVIPATNDASFPVIIADTMNGKNLIAFYPNMANVDGSSGGRYIKYQVDGKKAPSIKGTAHYVPAIAQELLTALDYSMDWNAPLNSVYKRGGVVKIPKEVVAHLGTDNVSLIGPEIIAIADQFNWIGNHAMSFFTMSNTQIVENVQHFCYARNIGGVTKFFYSTRNPLDAPSVPNLVANPSTGAFIWQVYSNQEQCAISGFEPDLEYFGD